MSKLRSAFDALVVVLALLFLLVAIIAIVRQQPSPATEVARPAPTETEPAQTPTQVMVSVQATESVEEPTAVPATPTIPPTTTQEMPHETPTLAPVATGAGLGVSRASVQSMFEELGIGFEFGMTSEEGHPRVIGKAAEDSPILIELVGPSDNLVSASITVPLPDDDPDTVAENVKYMSALLQLAAPNWERGSDWLSANLPTAVETGEVQATRGSLQIILQYFKDLELAVLTVEAKASPTPLPTSSPTPTVVQAPTGTLAPTQAPSPTSTSITPQELSAVVTARGLNVRAGPGPGYQRLGAVGQGTQLILDGRNRSGTWVHGRAPEAGLEGWLSNGYMDIAGDVMTLPVIEAGATN